MSSAKSSKADKKKDEKKIVVSFSSDSDDDKSSSSSSSSSESSSEEEVKSKSSVVPVRKSVTKDLKESKPSTTQTKSSPATKKTTDQQQPSESASSNEQETPAHKTTKSKTKETTKPVTDMIHDNGMVSPSSDKSNKSVSSESPKEEVKIKKKSSTKSESSAINGSAQPSNTVSDVKPKVSEKEAEDVVVKTTTKIKKKTSKTTELVENGDADLSKLNSKKSSTEETVDTQKSENVKNKEKPVQLSTSDESNPKPVKKTTKKSSKTASTVIDGEGDKTVVEDLNDKLAEKKVSTKSKELIKETGSNQNETTAKLDKEDSIKRVEDGKQIVANDPKEQQIGVAEKSEEKPKVKKKKEKPVEVVQVPTELAAATAAAAVEAPAISSEVPTTDVKVVRKKKVKKVAPADVPDAAAVPIDVISVPKTLSPATEANLQAKDVIDKSELDADREVQAICDAQFNEKSGVSSPIVNLENESTVGEPSSVSESQSTEPASAAVEINKDGEETGATLVVVENNEATLQNTTTLQNDSSIVGSDLSLTNGNYSFTPEDLNAVTTTTSANEEDKDFLAITDKKDSSPSNEVGKPRVNEESDFSYRRKSMDDFIKRILAEAREEQQKRTGNTSTTDSSSVLSETEKPDQPNGFAADSDRFAINKESISTDRKRVQQNAHEDLQFSSSKTGVLTDLDLDEDLAQIKGYFSRRTKPELLNDDEVLTSETSFRSRISRLDVGNDDDINQKLLRDVIPVDDGSSYLSRLRQQQQQLQNTSSSDRRDTLSEDQFCPRRRDETSDVVRGSILPVRSVIDQQAEVIQQLKTTSRSVDDLENEIRSLRETFLDRQARIDSLRQAIDAENRVYDAEQTAANDRIQQQKIPGGHFVREEFMATLIPPRQTPADSLFRQRSGSVSSGSAADLGFGSRSASVSGARDPFSFVRAGSLKPGSVSGSSSSQRRQLFDTDDSSSPITASGYGGMSGILRRASSVARERTQTSEELYDGIGGGGTSSWTPPARLSTDGSSPYSGNSSWLSYNASTTPESTASRFGSSYSSTGYSRYQSDQNDYRSPSSYSSSSIYSSPSERISSRLGLDRSYTRDAASPSPSISERYSSTDGGSIDSSRTRRAQSVFDTSSDNRYSTSYDNSYVSSLSSSGGSAAGGGGGGEFQSRFLDKVRGKKAAGEDISSSSSGSGQFKSRFLRSNFDSTSKKY